jgi:hypothetical protein
MPSESHNDNEQVIMTLYDGVKMTFFTALGLKNHLKTKCKKGGIAFAITILILL